MKKSTLLLSSAALPLMLMASPVSANPLSKPEPLVVAQGSDGSEMLLRRPDETGQQGGRPQRGDRSDSLEQRPPPEQSRERSERPDPRQQERRQGEAPERPRERREPAATERPSRPAEAPERTRRSEERPERAPRPAAREREQAPAAASPAERRRPADRQETQERQERRDRQEQRRDERPDRADRPDRPDRRDRAREEAPDAQPRTRPIPPAPAAQRPAQEAPRPDEAQRPDRQRDERPRQGARPDAPIQAGPRAGEPLDPRSVRIEDLRNQRRQRTEEGGRRVIIEEPGNRTIIRENGRTIIRHDETERFRRLYDADDIRVERRGQDEEVTIVRRPDGSEIISVRDQDGNLIRRIRREPAGREVILIENRRGDRRPGYRYGLREDIVRLPPPVVSIPREEYIVEVESASQEDLVEAFTAPPVERVERAYTLDEVRLSQPLRERMRRVDLDTITFDFGSWELAGDQANAMTGIANALERALSQNPNEVFLIEGHTDAVGSDEDNLTLSDRRAETVATILSQRFGIPAENLTTQGYGEQYLKVDSQGPERANRRATIRRITPLLQGQNQQ